MASSLIERALSAVISEGDIRVGIITWDRNAMNAMLREFAAAMKSSRDFAATICEGYKPNQCDCDPSVGITGCIVCAARAVIDEIDGVTP